MPIIQSFQESDLPIAVLSGGSAFEADGAVLQYFHATLAGGSSFQANGTFVELFGAADLGGGSGWSALGRLGDEANVFGIADLGGGSSIDLNGILLARAQAIIAGGSSFGANGRVAEADRGAINIFLTIADQPGVGRADVISARIFADAVSYPITGYQLTEGESDAGTVCNVTLARPSDRAAILAADEFTFDVYSNGAWKTIFTSGRRIGADFAFAWADVKSADTLSISTAGPITERLRRSPSRNLTVYDPLREDINADQFEGILDEFGEVYEHQLYPIVGMKIFNLFDYIYRTRVGFDRVVSTLPNDPIRRVDLLLTETFHAGVSGPIGTWNPLTFVVNNVLYLLDPTIKLPAGFPVPVVLDATQYKNAQFSIVEQTADGAVVTYAQSEAEYDRHEDNTIEGEPSEEGTGLDFTETTVDVTYRKYYKNTDPATPVRTDKIGQETRIRGWLDGVFSTINTTTETITHDSKLRLQTVEKTKTATIPDISGTFGFVTREVRSEVTTFQYRPDPKNPRREYLFERQTKVTGLVVDDEAAPNFDRPFRQEFYDFWRGGNYTGESQTVSTAAIYLERETTIRTNRGQNELRFISINYLTTPVNVHTEITEARGGDPTTNAETTAAEPLIVYREGITEKPENAQFIQIAGGEFSVRSLKALAKRRLSTDEITGQVELKGINWSLGRGAVFQLNDPGGESVGTFIVEGRSTSAANLGTRMQQTRQILNVRKIQTDGSPLSLGQTQPAGLVLPAGGSSEFSIPIACEGGYSLLTDTDSGNVIVSAKANLGDSYQDIHRDESPLDLTPYAGELRTFYFKIDIDAGAADGEEIVSILIAKT